MHINIYQIQYMAWKCSDMMKGQIMTECVLSIRFEKGSTPWSSDNMMFQALGNCYGPIVQLEIEFPDCPIPLFSSEKTVWKISFISLDFYHIFPPSIYYRYPKNFFRDLLRSSVLVCSDEIKFKIFFAFVVLDTIAWLNRLGSSKFYFIYLFFVPENPP